MTSTDERMCKCERCPSYPDCGGDTEPMVFCRKGKAPCRVILRGCVCTSCKVHEMYGFRREYYCIQGADTSKF